MPAEQASDIERSAKPPVPPAPPTTARRWAAVLVAAAVGVVAYWPSVDHDFSYDDHGIIARDTRLDEPGFGIKLWIAPWWPEGSAAPASRPLTTFTLWAQVQTHGRQAWAFHLVNVLLYAVLCAQVAAMCRRWTGSEAAAWVGGLLFAVHPLHVEVVANVVGRAETLTAIFSVLAIDLYLRWRGSLTWRRSVAIGAAILLAGLSKEHGYFTVAMLGALELAARRAEGVTKLRALASNVPWRLAAVIAVVAAVAVVQRVAMTRAAETKPGTVSEMDNPLFYAGRAERIVTPLKLIGKAASLTVAPADQSPDYSPSMLMPTADVNDPQVIAGLLIALAWAGLCAAAWVKRWRVLGPLLMLPVAWLIPSNTLLLIGTIFGERLLFMATVVLAMLAGHTAAGLIDRRRVAGGVAIAAVAGSLVQLCYTYFAWESYWMPPDAGAVTVLDPQLGVALAVLAIAAAGVGVLGWRAMRDRAGAGALVAAVVAIVVSHGAATLCYSGVWKDQTTLAFTTVSRHPLSGRFQGFHAAELLRLAMGNEDPAVSKQFLDAAEHHARLALEYWPRQSNPYIVLAAVAHRSGDVALARRYAEYARAASPTGAGVDAVAEYMALIAPRGELRERADALKQKIAESPEGPGSRAAMLELALTLADLREYDEAIGWYEKLYDPSLTDARLLDGYLNALLSGGKWEEAMKVYRNWVEREPNNWAVMTDAALVSMAGGVELERAGAWLKRATELAPARAEPWAGLGQWHEVHGRIDEADRMYRKAIALSAQTDPKRAQYVFMLERLHQK